MIWFIILVIFIMGLLILQIKSPQSTIPQSTTPQSTIPQSTTPQSIKKENQMQSLPQKDDPNYPDLAKVPLDQRGFGPDCYLFPDETHPDGYFCQLNDRNRWIKKEQPTRGRFILYQKECMSCTESLEDTLIYPENYPALNIKTLNPDGQFNERPSICGPGLICTGNNIPVLPPTCVQKRPPDRNHPPTRDELIQWALRFVRLGGRPSKGLKDRKCLLHSKENGICIRYHDSSNASPLTKGASKEDLIKTANHILRVLWPKEFQPYPGTLIPGEHDKDVPFCDDENYINQLKDYQKENGKADYRAPIPNNGKENAPPCIWGSDYAYNDEGPSCWSLLHTLTANLPTIITDEQKEALRLIPMYLRQELSCGDCRSHIREHFIDIGIPNSNFGFEWFKYFWRAHNYVNEQTAHTRCGENMDCGLPWAFDSNICMGKYKYPWYMSLSDAFSQWKIH